MCQPVVYNCECVGEVGRTRAQLVAMRSGRPSTTAHSQGERGWCAGASG